MESCTFALGVFCFNGARVLFNNRADDGEPHAQALRLGCKELLKYSASHFLRNADTIITHADANSPSTVFPSHNFDATFRYRSVAHGVKRIQDKIDQDLLNLDRINRDYW